jgi:hypothetical protein
MKARETRPPGLSRSAKSSPDSAASVSVSHHNRLSLTGVKKINLVNGLGAEVVDERVAEERR